MPTGIWLYARSASRFGRVAAVAAGVAMGEYKPCFAMESETDTASKPVVSNKLEAAVMIQKMAPTENIAEYTGEKAATYTFDKYLVSIGPDSDRAGFEKYAQENDMICFDHGHDVWEVTLAKYTKATGIQFLLDHLDMSLEDSFAFGDSTNDLAMLKYAGTSIAMGNSMPEIFPFCTYRTTGITDNGIWNAMKHFQLI